MRSRPEKTPRFIFVEDENLLKFKPRYTGAIAFALGVAIFVLAACGRNVQVLPPDAAPVEANPASGSVQAPAQFSLPNPTATSEPTLFATRVITQTATSTHTPTPIPTRTPTPTQAPAASTPVSVVATPAAVALPPKIEHVVIISIDGLRPDALAVANTPNLDALRAAGAYSPNAKAVVPSVTLINHASMLGGMSPAKHGVNWNIYDASRGKVNGPTLFSLARQAGLSTAMVVGKEKFDHLVLPGSVDNYLLAGFTDQQVTGQAISLIQAGLSAILFIHLPDVDTQGHSAGWMSAGQLQTITLTDEQIGKIINALDVGGYRDSTLIIVTSDHGGTGASHGSDSAEDTTIPWLAVGPTVRAGVTIERTIIIYDTAATVLHSLGLPIPEQWDGQPVLEIFN